MNQSKCPRCGDPVRIPADLPEKAIVRCPLCSQEFEFAEMAVTLPPLLLVVSLPEDRPAANFEFLELAEKTVVAPSIAAAPRVGGSSVSSRSRRRPAESPWRPIILLAEIAASGVVGIALAVLVLWWLPGKWHRDPLSLKPVAARYAPWLLPPAHRPRAELVSTDEENLPAQRARASQPQRRNESDAKPSSSRKPAVASLEEPRHETSRDDREIPADVEPTEEEPAKTPPPVAEPPPERQPTFEELMAMQDPDALEPPDLQWTSSPDLTAMIRDATRRRTEGPKPAPAIPELAEPDFTSTFLELARVAGQLNAEDIGREAAQARLREWLPSVTEDEWRKACMATAAVLEKPSIAPRGVIYLARLEAATAEGSWLHLDLDPMPSSPIFPILIEPQLFRDWGGERLIGKEIYVLASELPDPKRLISDVPTGVKTTWLVGAIWDADSSAKPANPPSDEEKKGDAAAF